MLNVSLTLKRKIGRNKSVAGAVFPRQKGKGDKMTDFILGVTLTLFFGVQAVFIGLVFGLYKLLKILIFWLIRQNEKE